MKLAMIGNSSSILQRRRSYALQLWLRTRNDEAGPGILVDEDRIAVRIEQQEARRPSAAFVGFVRLEEPDHGRAVKGGRANLCLSGSKILRRPAP